MFQLDIRIAMTGMSVFIGSAQRIATSVVLVLQHHRHKQHCCTNMRLTIPLMIQIVKIMIQIMKIMILIINSNSNNNNNNDDYDKSFPAHDELGTCRYTKCI